VVLIRKGNGWIVVSSPKSTPSSVAEILSSGLLLVRVKYSYENLSQISSPCLDATLGPGPQIFFLIEAQRKPETNENYKIPMAHARLVADRIRDMVERKDPISEKIIMARRHNGGSYEILITYTNNSGVVT
jgi:hypothetical protein